MCFKVGTLHMWSLRKAFSLSEKFKSISTLNTEYSFLHIAHLHSFYFVALSYREFGVSQLILSFNTARHQVVSQKLCFSPFQGILSDKNLYIHFHISLFVAVAMLFAWFCISFNTLFSFWNFLLVIVRDLKNFLVFI